MRELTLPSSLPIVSFLRGRPIPPDLGGETLRQLQQSGRWDAYQVEITAKHWLLEADGQRKNFWSGLWLAFVAFSITLLTRSFRAQRILSDAVWGLVTLALLVFLTMNVAGFFVWLAAVGGYLAGFLIPEWVVDSLRHARSAQSGASRGELRKSEWGSLSEIVVPLLVAALLVSSIQAVAQDSPAAPTLNPLQDVLVPYSQQETFSSSELPEILYVRKPFADYLKTFANSKDSLPERLISRAAYRILPDPSDGLVIDCRFRVYDFTATKPESIWLPLSGFQATEQLRARVNEEEATLIPTAEPAGCEILLPQESVETPEFPAASSEDPAARNVSPRRYDIQFTVVPQFQSKEGESDADLILKIPPVMQAECRYDKLMNPAPLVLSARGGTSLQPQQGGMGEDEVRVTLGDTQELAIRFDPLGGAAEGMKPTVERVNATILATIHAESVEYQVHYTLARESEMAPVVELSLPADAWLDTLNSPYLQERMVNRDASENQIVRLTYDPETPPEFNLQYTYFTRRQESRNAVLLRLAEIINQSSGDRPVSSSVELAVQSPISLKLTGLRAEESSSVRISPESFGSGIGTANGLAAALLPNVICYKVTNPIGIEVPYEFIPVEVGCQLAARYRVGRRSASLSAKVTIEEVNRSQHELSLKIPPNVQLREVFLDDRQAIKVIHWSHQKSLLTLFFPEAIKPEFEVHLEFRLPLGNRERVKLFVPEILELGEHRYQLELEFPEQGDRWQVMLPEEPTAASLFSQNEAGQVQLQFSSEELKLIQPLMLERPSE